MVFNQTRVQCVIHTLTLTVRLSWPKGKYVQPVPFIWFGFAHHRVRWACPEPCRRAHHERKVRELMGRYASGYDSVRV